MDFLGETEEEFEDTYKTLEQIKLYKIHVFQYSKRENTKAASFENQISPEIKEERSKRIIELSNMMQNEYNNSYIGRTINVLIEEKENGALLGHTSNYLYVKVKDNEENLRNEIIKVLVNGAEEEMLLGEKLYL